jgi:nitroreductase
MDALETMAGRTSVRAYRPDPIDDETLRRILEAARLAPTAANRQPFQIIVAHVAGREAELRRVYHRPWFLEAPLVLCVCGIPAQGWVRRFDGANYTTVDAAIVMDHLILAAASLGLGTCWIAAFDPAATREVFGLPSGVEPIALTPLGFPADRPGAKERKPLTELVRWERW